MQARLDDFLETAVERGFSGVVLVQQQDQTLLHKSYAPPHSPLTRDSRFWLSSVSKMFAAASMVKLALRGEVDLHAPIQTYFPNVPADKQQITLHHLLTHTSGLGDTYAAEGITDPLEAAQAVLATPLQHVTGSRYLYSNGGYQLVGVLLEVVSGRAYETVLQEEILFPAGMTHTSFWGESSENLAPSSNTFPEPLQQPNYGFRGSTGLCSTADDLLKWHHVMLGDSVLSKPARQLIFTPHIYRTPRLAYGYGWQIVETSRQTRLLAHGGADDGLGHFTYFYRFMDEGVVVILLSNATEAVADETIDGVFGITFG